MENQKQSLSIPVAIIIAGLLVAGGIYWTGRNGQSAAAPSAIALGGQEASLDSIKPLQPTDHVQGDPKSKIVIIEYSDTECPFCKSFNATLHQLMIAYPGQIAWAFRHFPVHTKSVHEETALECAAELGGNDAFWQFTDRVFSMTNSNDSLDPAALPQIARALGLDPTAFATCLNSGKYDAKIEQDKQDVIAAGAQGTPYSVIFAGGQKIPISQGALPYSAMKNIIDTILKNS